MICKNNFKTFKLLLSVTYSSLLLLSSPHYCLIILCIDIIMYKETVTVDITHTICVPCVHN